MLGQVFVKGDFDNKPVEQGFYSRIKKIRLIIAEDNYAAIAIAKKNGFSKISEMEYELTKYQHLERLKNQRIDELER